MTNEFTMDLRIEVFHPNKPNSFLKDESQVTVGTTPMQGQFPNPLLTGMSETVAVVQKDNCIARVVLATIASVLKQNEDRKTREK